MRASSRIPPSVVAVGVAALLAAGVAPRVTLAAPDAPPTRPTVEGFQSFDYASLPLLEASLPGSAKCAVSSFRVGPVRPRFAYERAVKPAAPQWIVEGLGRDVNLRIDREHLVGDLALFRSPVFDHATARAEWMKVDRDALTADAAPVSRCEAHALFDSFIHAEQLERGTARALVPGRVYAYRRCVDGCDAPLGSSARVEELGVVTSPAIWISSSGWGSNGGRGRDTFSRGFAAVEVGATATIVVGLPLADDTLGPLRSAPAKDGADTFDIEVTWIDGAFELTLFAGHAAGDPAALAVESY